jgi:hypothetical protein
MDYSKFLTNDDSEWIRNYKLKEYSLIGEAHRNEILLPKNAHLNCTTVGSVGNISFAVHHLYFFKGNCENIYMDFNNRNIKWGNENPYDKVFNQQLTSDYQMVCCWGLSLFNYDSISLEDIRKNTQHYFKFNQNLTKIVNNIALEKNINEKTLGVHIRMNDWNICHGNQLGYVYYEDYVIEIDNLLDNNDINNIFVGSDNYETIEKLKSKYGDKILIADDISRNMKEQQDDMGFITNNFEKRLSNEYDFITPFIDFLLLIKCGYFIGRKYSNFSCAATYLGNMKFENIINLPINKK